MELESQRLLFKEITWDDLEDIHRLQSTVEVAEFNTLGIPADISVTRKRVAPAIDAQTRTERNSYEWKVVEKNTNAFIGVAGISLSADRFKLGEIYYDILPSHWGQGYATETAKSIIKFGFEVLGLHKVEAGVATGNIRSVRVLEKAGMTREGLRRKILPIRGEWKDNFHYAIVEDDPRDY